MPEKKVQGPYVSRWFKYPHFVCKHYDYVVLLCQDRVQLKFVNMRDAKAWLRENGFELRKNA